MRALLRLVLRRDRLRLPLWIYLGAALPITSYASFSSYFATEAQRTELAQTLGTSAAVRLLFGPARQIDQVGGFTAWRSLTFASLLVALMCLFTVVRHTRSEEDAGRAELLAAAPLPQHARLDAALCAGGGAALACGVLTFVGLLLVGAELAGAAVLGCALACVGLVFTAVAALAAQLAGYSRGATGISLGVLGVAFMLRAAADASGVRWIGWVSPLSWGEYAQAFTGDHWWSLLPAPCVAALGVALARWLERVRDLGAGVLGSRAGASGLPARIAGGSAAYRWLIWRRQRGAIAGWLAGYLVPGGLFGGIINSSAGALAGSGSASELFSRGAQVPLALAITQAIVALLGLTVSFYTVSAIADARSEETLGRAELLLSTPLRRLRWLGGHLVAGLGAVLAVLAAGGLALATATTVSGVPGVHFGATLAALAAQLPAVWVVGGSTALLVAHWPRFTSLAWALAGLCVFLTYFAPMFHLSHLLVDLSPFSHLPRGPGGPLVTPAMGVLLALAVALNGAALAGIRRRDLCG